MVLSPSVSVLVSYQKHVNFQVKYVIEGAFRTLNGARMSEMKEEDETTWTGMSRFFYGVWE